LAKKPPKASRKPLPDATKARRQRFCELWATLKNGQLAYERAGFTARGHAAAVEASKLMKLPEIRAKIAGLLEAQSKRTRRDADWVLAQLETNHHLARADGQMAASNKAVELIGDHFAMFVKRVDVSNMSDEELARRAAEIVARQKESSDGE
jgi:phage terminase small subunit